MPSAGENTRRIALCGLMAALSLTLLLLGSLMPLFTYACPILAMLPLLPVLEEYGTKSARYTYLAAAALGVLLVGDKEIALLFLFWGYYPVLRVRLCTVRRRAVRVAVKLLIGNAATAAAYALMLFVFGMAALKSELAGMGAGMLFALAVMGNAVFILLDVLLGRFSRLYARRIRGRWRH